MAERQFERLETLAAHAGEGPVPPTTRPVSMPIYQTSVFAFPDLETVEEVYNGRSPAYLYSRMAHPNARALEEAYAALEGAEDAMATASGMAAIFAVFFSLLSPGDHLICSRELYGGTYSLLAEHLDRWGIATDYVDTTDLGAVEAAIRPETRMIFVEAITNPTVQVADLPALSRLAFRRGLWLVVDNTFATPYLLRPLEHGADLVVISATKFLGGHSDLTGGLVAGSRALIDRIRRCHVVTGATPDPFAAWLCLRGMKTLHLRLERQSQNALALAWFLSRHPWVEAVHYPGLPSHPQSELARRLLPRGAGGILSFAVRGDEEAAGRVIRSLRLASLVPSLGDVTTTVSHPASTSHRTLPPETRAQLGITPNLIRVSVGTEAVEEILADFEAALATLG